MIPSIQLSTKMEAGSVCVTLFFCVEPASLALADNIWVYLKTQFLQFYIADNDIVYSSCECKNSRVLSHRTTERSATHQHNIHLSVCRNCGHKYQ